MKRKSGSSPKVETGQWLTTYADLMNNLLVFFMLLYAMSIMDLEKFKALMSSFGETFGTKPGTTVTETSDVSYDEIYEIPSEDEYSFE